LKGRTKLNLDFLVRWYCFANRLFFYIFIKISIMKKIYLSAFLFSAITMISQVPSVGLIAQWPFSGSANDVIGGNNGTVTGATLTTDRFGNPNCAYNFNGINNKIVMLSAGPTGTVSRTVSFWEKSNSTSGPTSGFSYGPGGGGSIFQINFNYMCQAVGFDNSSIAVMHGSSIINNNQWHHIVAVHDATVGLSAYDVKIYIDGVLQSAVTCSLGSNVPINSSSGVPIMIGLDVPSGARYFKGDLDDFFLYNRALTPTEVLALYNDVSCTGAPAPPNSVVGPASACIGSTVIYSVSPVAGASSYSWTLPGGWTGTSTTNTISVVIGSTPGQITVASRNCCSASQPVTLDISVDPSPSVSITSSQLTICKGNSTTLLANGATSYTWNTSATTSSITVSPTITTSYSVTGSNTVGCSNSAITSVSVTNNSLPTISVSGPSLSCSGQNISLASNGASTYTWQPGLMNGFLVSVSPTVTTVYTVTGTDANGCYNSATYTQSVSACTGINFLTSGNAAFSVYPNPFTDVISISIQSNKNTPTEIEVYSIAGKLLVHTIYDQPNINIDLSKLDSGIYFIKLKNSEGTATKKIIKLQ
jgi:hypothetical protein